MKQILLLSLAFVLISCSNDDENNNENPNLTDNFLTIGSTNYELKGGSIEDYGEYEAGIFNFDIVLITTSVNFIGGEFMPEDQVYSGIYFELFTDNQGDLAVGTYTQVALEDIGAQTFEYSEIAQNVEFEDEDDSGIFSELVEGSIDIISNGPEYELEFNGVDDLGRTISGYYKGTLISVD